MGSWFGYIFFLRRFLLLFFLDNTAARRVGNTRTHKASAVLMEVGEGKRVVEEVREEMKEEVRVRWKDEEGDVGEREAEMVEKEAREEI